MKLKWGLTSDLTGDAGLVALDGLVSDLVGTVPCLTIARDDNEPQPLSLWFEYVATLFESRGQDYEAAIARQFTVESE